MATQFRTTEQYFKNTIKYWDEMQEANKFQEICTERYIKVMLIFCTECLFKIREAIGAAKQVLAKTLMLKTLYLNTTKACFLFEGDAYEYFGGMSIEMIFIVGVVAERKTKNAEVRFLK